MTSWWGRCSVIHFGMIIRTTGSRISWWRAAASHLELRHGQSTLAIKCLRLGPSMQRPAHAKGWGIPHQQNHILSRDPQLEPKHHKLKDFTKEKKENATVNCLKHVLCRTTA